MSHELKVGIVGLDTSHATAFTKLLNDPKDANHVSGGRVVVGYAGGSPDFELSISRVGRFTQEVRDMGVKIVDTPEAVAEESDVIFLESTDGRVHLAQFKRLMPFKKPVFIDKPFTVSAAEARELVALIEKSGLLVASWSPIRFAAGLKSALSDNEGGAVVGADLFGPFKLQPTQTRYFWYVIHTAEALFALMGPGCRQVSVTTGGGCDIITGVWKDGRMGVIRANPGENNVFGGVLHRAKTSKILDLTVAYHLSLEGVMRMFKEGKPPVTLQETLEIVSFLEAANESFATGKSVML